MTNNKAVWMRLIITPCPRLMAEVEVPEVSESVPGL
jgi:hypothetical protein